MNMDIVRHEEGVLRIERQPWTIFGMEIPSKRRVNNRTTNMEIVRYGNSMEGAC